VVKVKVLETDEKGRVKLSMKALTERPAGMPEREPRDPVAIAVPRTCSSPESRTPRESRAARNRAAADEQQQQQQ
jgi:polyribonucleotide nucleotidyltransferase